MSEGVEAHLRKMLEEARRCSRFEVNYKHIEDLEKLLAVLAERRRHLQEILSRTIEVLERHYDFELIAEMLDVRRKYGKEDTRREKPLREALEVYRDLKQVLGGAEP